MTTTTSLGTSPATRASGGPGPGGFRAGLHRARLRARGPAGPAPELGPRFGLDRLILGVVTIMSLAVFWLALPPVFGGGIRDHRSQLKITS